MCLSIHVHIWKVTLCWELRHSSLSWYTNCSSFAHCSGSHLITAANFCMNGKLAVVGTYDGRCIFYETEVCVCAPTYYCFYPLHFEQILHFFQQLCNFSCLKLVWIGEDTVYSVIVGIHGSLYIIACLIYTLPPLLVFTLSLKFWSCSLVIFSIVSASQVPHSNPCEISAWEE